MLTVSKVHVKIFIVEMFIIQILMSCKTYCVWVQQLVQIMKSSS